MAKIKTNETSLSVGDFINSYADNDQKKNDSHRLIELMSEWSGFDAKMWGASIIGFGSYHYRYASGHEGDAPLMVSRHERQRSPYMFIRRYLNRKRS